MGREGFEPPAITEIKRLARISRPPAEYHTKLDHLPLKEVW